MALSLALVVVTHNSAAWLAPLIESWIASAQSAAITAPIIVSDSGSNDDTLKTAAQFLPDAAILRLGNIGFGAAANAAIRQTSATWILLCNPDLTFPPPFAALIAFAASAAAPNVACIAPRLLNPDGTLQPSVGRFPTIAGMLVDQLRPRPRRKYTFPQPAAAAPVDWATGACLLIRREVFGVVADGGAAGGFDEKYFLYAEEVDLQRRLHAAGHITWFDPTITVTHHQPNASQSPRPEIQRYAARGILRYYAKFGGGLTAFRLMAFLAGRLPAHEAFAARREILERATGP